VPGVGEQRDPQVMLPDEPAVALLRVRAYSQNDRIEPRKFVELIGKALCFQGASFSLILFLEFPGRQPERIELPDRISPFREPSIQEFGGMELHLDEVQSERQFAKFLAIDTSSCNLFTYFSRPGVNRPA
jgi:hypothetical protein